MENSLEIAQILYNKYLDKFHQPITETTMHKLMYLIQRESLIRTKSVLFDDDFYVIKIKPELRIIFGLELPVVAEEFHSKENPFNYEAKNFSKDILDILDFVIDKYTVSTWKLTTLCFSEISFKIARKSLKAGNQTRVKMELKMMKGDAIREKFERKHYPES